MRLKNWFDAGADVDSRERTVSVYARLFGIDFNVAAYGYLNDWVAPFMFVPKLWGFFFQILGLSVYIGRLKGMADVEV